MRPISSPYDKSHVSPATQLSPNYYHNYINCSRRESTTENSSEFRCLECLEFRLRYRKQPQKKTSLSNLKTCICKRSSLKLSSANPENCFVHHAVPSALCNQRADTQTVYIPLDAAARAWLYSAADRERERGGDDVNDLVRQDFFWDPSLGPREWDAAPLLPPKPPIPI